MHKNKEKGGNFGSSSVTMMFSRTNPKRIFEVDIVLCIGLGDWIPDQVGNDGKKLRE